MPEQNQRIPNLGEMLVPRNLSVHKGLFDVLIGANKWDVFWSYSILCELAYQRPTPEALLTFGRWLGYTNGLQWLETPGNIDVNMVWAADRNGVVISFSGTENLEQASYYGVNIGLTPRQFFSGRVHDGFYSLWLEANKYVIEILESVPDQTPVSFCGHSLGGAIAQLMGIYYQSQTKRKVANVVTFGTPIIGAFEVTNGFRVITPPFYPFRNDGDPIPGLPPAFLAFVSGSLIASVVDTVLLAYSPVNYQIVLNEDLSVETRKMGLFERPTIVYSTNQRFRSVAPGGLAIFPGTNFDISAHSMRLYQDRVLRIGTGARSIVEPETRYAVVRTIGIIPNSATNIQGVQVMPSEISNFTRERLIAYVLSGEFGMRVLTTRAAKQVVVEAINNASTVEQLNWYIAGIQEGGSCTIEQRNIFQNILGQPGPTVSGGLGIRPPIPTPLTQQVRQQILNITTEGVRPNDVFAIINSLNNATSVEQVIGSLLEMRRLNQISQRQLDISLGILNQSVNNFQANLINAQQNVINNPIVRELVSTQVERTVPSSNRIILPTPDRELQNNLPTVQQTDEEYRAMVAADEAYRRQLLRERSITVPGNAQQPPSIPIGSLGRIEDEYPAFRPNIPPPGFSIDEIIENLAPPTRQSLGLRLYWMPPAGQLITDFQIQQNALPSSQRIIMPPPPPVMQPEIGVPASGGGQIPPASNIQQSPSQLQGIAQERGQVTSVRPLPPPANEDFPYNDYSNRVLGQGLGMPGNQPQNSRPAPPTGR